MKRILVLLLLLPCLSTAFAQHDYIIDMYSATDMNIKGKVKKVTETQVYTDKKGKVDDEERKMKFVYEFDESGKLIKQQTIELEDDDETVNSTYTYEYTNGKISKTAVAVRYSGTQTRLFAYTSSAITLKIPSGEIAEVRSLSNGRISEITHYGRSQTSYSHQFRYEYNTTGQIVKETYNGDKYSNYTTFEKYEYNKQGDTQKKEQYGKEGKLDWITDYEFTYDNNKNWTKCRAEFYQPGENKNDRTYTLRTRTYEFY